MPEHDQFYSFRRIELVNRIARSLCDAITQHTDLLEQKLIDLAEQDGIDLVIERAKMRFSDYTPELRFDSILRASEPCIEHARMSVNAAERMSELLVEYTNLLESLDPVVTDTIAEQKDAYDVMLTYTDIADLFEQSMRDKVSLYILYPESRAIVSVNAELATGKQGAPRVMDVMPQQLEDQDTIAALKKESSQNDRAAYIIRSPAREIPPSLVIKYAIRQLQQRYYNISGNMQSLSEATGMPEAANMDTEITCKTAGSKHFLN